MAEDKTDAQPRSRWAPLDVNDGVALVRAMLHMHTAISELATQATPDTQASVGKLLQQVSEALSATLDSISKKVP